MKVCFISDVEMFKADYGLEAEPSSKLLLLPEVKVISFVNKLADFQMK
jgi:hypothetical protein